MSKRDILTLLLTAGMGLITGAYLYVIVFAPVYVDTEPTLSADRELIIVGQEYGGCVRVGCASFRLTSSRSYQFLPTGSGGATTPLLGTYPSDEYEELTQQLAVADIVALAAPRDQSGCDSYVDGVDRRYIVTLDGERYDLDTCTTNLAKDRATLQSLDQIFQVLSERALR